MTVKEIVAAWLKEHGYDGLCISGNGYNCGCGIDDLIPCGEFYDKCVAAYRHEASCTDCNDEFCSHDYRVSYCEHKRKDESEND